MEEIDLSLLQGKRGGPLYILISCSLRTSPLGALAGGEGGVCGGEKSLRLKIKKVKPKNCKTHWKEEQGLANSRLRPSLETHGQIVGERESNFLRANFSRPFRLSLTPTICRLVSEDGARPSLRKVPSSISSDDLKSFFRPLSFSFRPLVCQLKYSQQLPT